MQRSLLLQHQRAFAADRRDELFRDLAEQPRQRDLDADAVVQHVDQAGGLLAERRGAEGQPVAGPGLLGNVEQAAELACRRARSPISCGAPPPRGQDGGERTQRRAGTWRSYGEASRKCQRRCPTPFTSPRLRASRPSSTGYAGRGIALPSPRSHASNDTRTFSFIRDRFVCGRRAIFSRAVTIGKFQNNAPHKKPNRFRDSAIPRKHALTRSRDAAKSRLSAPRGYAKTSYPGKSHADMNSVQVPATSFSPRC